MKCQSESQTEASVEAIVPLPHLQIRDAPAPSSSLLRSTDATSQDAKIEATRLANSIDERMGFPRYEAGRKKVGWLCNMHSTSVEDSRVPGGRAGVDFYFLEDDGGSFKATVEYDPYFLIATRRGKEARSRACGVLKRRT